MTDIFTRTVVERIPVADDLEVHVSKVEVDGLQAVDLRNFVPSTESYGRGLIIPAELVKAVRSALGKT